MAKPKPLIDDEGEVRELTAADFAQMKPFSALPKDEQAMLRNLGQQAKRRRGRPPKEAPKVAVTMRLDPDVAEFFRSSGEGWQTRLNALLAAHVKRASKRASSRSPKPAKSGRRVA